MESKYNPIEKIIVKNTKEGHFDAEKAQIDIATLRGLYESLLKTCQKRCLSLRFKTPELQTGEISCLDRCVERYIKSYTIITDVYDKAYNETK